MKILHVNKFFDLKGGAETYLHRLMDEQKKKGHEVHVFSTQSAGNLSSPDEPYFVERFDYTKHEGFSRDFKKGLAFIWNREARRGIRRVLKEVQPDVIHLHNIYHHLSSSILDPIKKSGIPCVQTLHDYKLACPNYKMFTEGRPCERCKGGRYYETVKHHCLSAGTAENVLGMMEMYMTKFLQSYEKTIRFFICPSQFMSSKMAEWGEPPSKLKFIPNPAFSGECAAIRDGDYFLMVGRLSAEKGFENIIQAMAKLPELKLRIAGSGPDEARLKQLVTTLGITNVTFLGFLNKETLQDERSHAMALIVPSVWYENAPLAVLEAMAECLPVIASRIGGLPELVTDGMNGYLVEPQDIEGWAKTLQKFADLPQEIRDKMGEESCKFIIEKLNWEIHVKALEQTYYEAGVKERR
ncbi:MAG: glycosyltransferase family 4 protein [Patescibacteria group bacterium]